MTSNQIEEAINESMRHDDALEEELENLIKQIFIDMNMEDDEVEMLADAYGATSLAGKWNYLKEAHIESFMFGDHLEVKEIHKHMKFKEHSGTSYGWTMRNIEYIAKHGKEEYQKRYTRKPACLCNKQEGKRGGQCGQCTKKVL